MLNKVVSVVVPIYNVEKYLDNCIESIVNQGYTNLEIILVDDGATDSSPIICDEWKKRDERVIVIHKENGGLSSARNAGLEEATGDYIMFIDSDDWVELDIVEKSVERIEKDKSDLVIFGYKKVDEKGKNRGEYTFGNGTYTKKELSQQLHRRILEMSFGYAWNKLYRLSVIKDNNIVNDGTIVDREDLYFNMSLLKYLNRISYMDCVGYAYLQRSNSLLHNGSLARLNGMNDFIKKMKVVSWGDKEQEEKVFNMVVLHYLADCIIKNIIWNPSLSKKEKIKKIREISRDFKNIGLRHDVDNPRYLRILYRGINNHNFSLFYYYSKMSYIKNILKK